MRNNGMTLDESFVTWMLNGYAFPRMVEELGRLSGISNTKQLNNTLRRKINNHKFYTLGQTTDRHFSIGHHEACVKFGVPIHPTACERVLRMH